MRFALMFLLAISTAVFGQQAGEFESPSNSSDSIDNQARPASANSKESLVDLKWSRVGPTKFEAAIPVVAKADDNEVVAELPRLTMGRDYFFHMELINRLEFPVTNVSSETSCGCMLAKAIETSIDPGARIPISIKLTPSEGDSVRRLKILAESDGKVIELCRFLFHTSGIRPLTPKFTRFLIEDSIDKDSIDIPFIQSDEVAEIDSAKIKLETSSKNIRLAQFALNQENRSQWNALLEISPEPNSAAESENIVLHIPFRYSDDLEWHDAAIKLSAYREGQSRIFPPLLVFKRKSDAWRCKMVLDCPLLADPSPDAALKFSMIWKEGDREVQIEKISVKFGRLSDTKAMIEIATDDPYFKLISQGVGELAISGGEAKNLATVQFRVEEK
jgi:hypothetical protein